MAKTGLAAVMPGIGKEFEIREYPVVDPWPGSIRIKISIANVCGSDIHTWQGDNAAGRARNRRVEIWLLK